MQDSQRLLRHEFSQLKFEDGCNPDFKGYPENALDEYTEETFEYDKIKVELVIEKEPLISKDRV
jgi:hypothetical protein